MFTSLC